jgi:hypothetical protein
MEIVSFYEDLHFIIFIRLLAFAILFYLNQPFFEILRAWFSEATMSSDVLMTSPIINHPVLNFKGRSLIPGLLKFSFRLDD